MAPLPLPSPHTTEPAGAPRTGRLCSCLIDACPVGFWPVDTNAV